MRCRYCGEQIPAGSSVCPACNKKNGALWQIVVAAVAALIVLACLAVVLLAGIAGVDWNKLDSIFKGEKATVQQNTQEPAVSVDGNNEGSSENTNVESTVEYYESDVDYTGTEAEAAEKKNVVVATVNGEELTNGLLQFYFNLEVSNFVNNNFSYLSYYGFDYNAPLNEQKSYDADMSWEAYFVVKAMNTWHQYQSIYAMALESGLELSAESQEYLDQIPSLMQQYADEGGYDSKDAWLKEYMNADITVDDYMRYSEMIALCSEYAVAQISTEPTTEEMEAYYEENAQYFEEFELTKESGAVVAVRHILLQPVSATEATTYTEEEWNACLADAEKLLQEWKDGDATEESFAALANKHSKDTGSNTTGGLYENITKDTSFVEPFLNWCMDESRQLGDTDIVKTDYGYHIMYFSATEPEWEYYAAQWILEDREIALISEAMETYPVESTMDNVCIHEFSFY